MLKHFLTDLDLDVAEQSFLLTRALELKAGPHNYARALDGKTLGMVFAKSSTRTRISFEVGMLQLGGNALFLPSSATQMGRGEPPEDTARVLSRYLDGIMVRTYEHAWTRALADASSVPVINGLDDNYHPCQVLADLLTIREKRGKVAGQQLVYVGDGNNMAHSLMLGGALAGLNVRIVAPDGFWPNEKMVAKARRIGDQTGATIEVTADVRGSEGADIVYTDVWASMGQEEESEARKKAFANYQVDAKMMKRAKEDAIFLHCLPAHRGEEVAADVIDGPQSVVFDQAENRLHAQKALMVHLMGRNR